MAVLFRYPHFAGAGVVPVGNYFRENFASLLPSITRIFPLIAAFSVIPSTVSIHPDIKHFSSKTLTLSPYLGRSLPEDNASSFRLACLAGCQAGFRLPGRYTGGGWRWFPSRRAGRSRRTGAIPAQQWPISTPPRRAVMTERRENTDQGQGRATRGGWSAASEGKIYSLQRCPHKL